MGFDSGATTICVRRGSPLAALVIGEFVLKEDKWTTTI
jgi:hypothetical protein